MIRILYGDKSVPVGGFELGKGLYANENDKGVLVLTTDPTDYGEQDGSAPAIREASDTVPLWYGVGGPIELGPVPLAATDLDPNFRPWKHISSPGYVRLCAVVTGAATAPVAITLTQSADGMSWANIATAELRLMLNQAGPIRTPWLPVDAAAAGDRLLRATLSGGDGVGTLTSTLCWVEFLAVSAIGAVPCVEVWRERFSDYADTAAMLAVWSVEVDPNGIADWSLDSTRALDGLACARIHREGAIIPGATYSLSRTVAGLLPNTTYQHIHSVWRHATGGGGGGGVIEDAWDTETTAIVSDAAGNGIVTLAHSPTSDVTYDKWFDQVRLVLCP